MIALTYDDGPNSIYTVQILNILRDAGARATFYVNPNNFNDSTIEVIHRMVAEGHEVAHHGWDHTAFSGHSAPGTGTHNAASAMVDLRQASQHIFDATGYWPWTFRAPFFEWREALGQDQRFNMAFHGANINPADYTIQGQPQTIANSVINASAANTDGAIALFHDDGGSRAGTVEATRLIVNAPALQNYHFVTVRELHYYYRNTPGRITAAPGAPGHTNVGPGPIVRNGVGASATGTPLWPTSPTPWWDLWDLPGEQNPWRNPVPPWER
jgi:peptidoglycan/xylan/chitin deacetylase (PgdA/CDA1 family)